MSIRVEHGDCLDVLPKLAAEGVLFDAVVCDPPYGLEFMGKEWDAPWQASSKSALFGKRQTKMPGWGVTRNPTCRTCGGRLRGAKRCSCEAAAWDEAPNATRLRQMSGFQDWCQDWAALVFAVMKPGAHLVAFGGTRTYHRMACAIEDAGFEIRDTLAWLYGAGFPKSHNLHGDWEGWGTALKPAFEPIILARKPIRGTVAANVLQHGTGALNIDGCRVESGGEHCRGAVTTGETRNVYGKQAPSFVATDHPAGRWPANVVHDGSDEVMRAFPEAPGQQRSVGPANGKKASVNVFGDYGARDQFNPRGDSGSAARFFYSAKADADDRAGSKHPTVKPLDLMRWLCRLVTPPKGLILDCFAGTGSTGEAARLEGFRAVLIEREAEYVADIHRRLARAAGGDTPLFASGTSATGSETTAGLRSQPEPVPNSTEAA